MSVAPPPVRPVSGGRHRVSDGAPSGAFTVPTGPFAAPTGPLAAVTSEVDAPARTSGHRHAAAPSVSFTRAARTAGISLAALGALATAGGFATQGIGEEAPATGEAALPSLASADFAVAAAAPAASVPAAVSAPEVLPQAAPAAVPAVSEAASTAAIAAAPARKADSDDADGSEESAAASAGSGIGSEAVAAAKSRLGKPYVWGATGPNKFDCSGLMVWSYKQAGKSLPRTSAAQSKAGQKVSMSDLQPGDLIFMYSPVSHVAMYVGNNQVIEAPTSGKNVRIVPLSKIKGRAVGVRRFA